MISTD